MKSNAGKVGLATLALTLLSAVAIAAPGDLDRSFDGDGTKAIDYGGVNETAQEILVQADGKVVLAGRGNSNEDFAVTRLNPDGSHDPSFDGDGVIGVDFGGETDTGYGAALQPNGKIVVAGSTNPPPVGSDIAVMRLNADGSLDTSFDGDGKKKIDYGGFDVSEDVLAQPDGKIVLAGRGNSNNDFAVTRLNADGSPDTTFDGDSVIGIDFGNIDHGYGVALQTDGKIVVAGSTTNGLNAAIVRLNTDGSPDTTFDGDGKKTIDFGGNDSARDVLLQPDGKIVLVGAGNEHGDLAIARLNSDGSPDPGFDGDGVIGVPFGDLAAYGLGVALQANGKIVVVGQSGNDMPIVRVQPGGSLDTTFSGDGKQVLLPAAFAPAAFSLTGEAVALQANGTIALAGRVLGDIAVARLEGDPASAGGGPSGGGPVSGGPGGGGSGGGSAVPRCAGKRATIVGSSRRDRLRGTRRADVIVSLGGNDTIKGGRGNDRICAGTGNDSVNGDSGNDRIYGQSGKDKIKGGTGNDTLDGGSSRDSLDGGKGRDRCTGGPGRDRAKCERKRRI